MTLAIIILVIVVIIELINWYGYSQIANMAYNIYLSVFQKENIKKQRMLKKDILQVKQELTRTSSQDQFAKWAKLRRKLDSKMNELEKISTSLGYMRTSFVLKFQTVLWGSINGIQIIMILWYRTTPVYYLPKNWFSPVGWIFSLPFSPSGAVSVSIWLLICRKITKKLVISSKDSVFFFNRTYKFISSKLNKSQVS